MTPHSTQHEDVIKELNSDQINGLSSSQVKELLEKYGENKLKEKKIKMISFLF